MASTDRERMMSQCSTSSDDSSMIYAESGTYAKVQVRGKKSASLSFRLSVVSLVISVVCLVILGVSFVLVIHSTELFSGKSCDQEKVCMPCDQLNPNPLAEKESPLLRQLDVHVEKGAETETMICCASTSAQYATLFKLVLTRQEEVKTLADIIGTGNENATGTEDNGVVVVGKRTASAHLLTKPTPRDFTDEMGNRLQQWKAPSESPLSHARGVKFLSNKLYVQSPGIYFVYCQVLYNRPNGEDPQEKKELMGLASHYVKRYSLLRPPSSGFLLKARHTRVTGMDDRHSSYVGGLFYLHPGDQLYVQVSVPQLVSHDDTASFFGLFKVSN